MICSITVINIACAQINKQSEEIFKFPTSKKVSLELPFAKNITVKTWDKQEVSFKTIIKADNEAVASIHERKVDESADMLRIETGYKEQKKYNNFCSCNTNRDSWNCVCIEINY